MPRIVRLVFAFFLVLRLPAQQPAWYPGSTYDPGVPAPQSVLGHEIGEYYTEHLQMTAYMRALEAASKRVKVFRVGESAERREILLVAISDPANMGRLEEIRTAVEKAVGRLASYSQRRRHHGAGRGHSRGMVVVERPRRRE
jgi:hypothetical protein